jgi:ATP/maltotriose-dependent transcriptional regulator MalT
LTTAIALFRQALALLPAQDSLLRPTVTLHLAKAHYLQREFEPASHLFTEIIAAGQTAPLMGSALLAIYIKVQILRAQGALQEALQLCQDELDLVTRHGWQNLPAAGSLYVSFGELSRERNELNRAAEYLEKGVNLGQAEGYPFISIAGHVWLAWLRQTQGDMTSSQEAIRTALQLVQHYQVNRFMPVPPAACYQARLWITQGNLAAASRWAQAVGVNQTVTPATYFDEIEYLTLARVRIAQGNLEAAETLLLRYLVESRGSSTRSRASSGTSALTVSALSRRVHIPIWTPRWMWMGTRGDPPIRRARRSSRRPTAAR